MTILQNYLKFNKHVCSCIMPDSVLKESRMLLLELEIIHYKCSRFVLSQSISCDDFIICLNALQGASSLEPLSAPNKYWILIYLENGNYVARCNF